MSTECKLNSVHPWTSGILGNQQLLESSRTPEWSLHHVLVPTSERPGRFLPLALKGDPTITFPILGFNRGFDLQAMREMLLGRSHWAIFRAWHQSGRELASDNAAQCWAGFYVGPGVNLGHFLLWFSRVRQPQKLWRWQGRCREWWLMPASSSRGDFFSSHPLSSPMIWNQILKQLTSFDRK